MCNSRAVALLLASICGGVLGAELYDVYFGKPLAGRRKEFLEAANGTALPQCTVLVEKCDLHEGRRVDGTCNNLRHPSRGSTRSPQLRLLPALFGPNNEIRSSSSGEPLPLVRRVRTQLFSDGLVASPPFSQLAAHYFVSTTVDLSSLIDLLTYGVVSDCCLGNRPNTANPRCIPIEVPEEDPYLRLTGIRCLNLTRVNSYQEAGCIPDTLPRDRINPATSLLDLSVVYGVDSAAEKRIRLYKEGKLRIEERDNRRFPPGNSLLCVNNKPPRENRCYEYGDQLGGNVLIGTNLYALWFYREHNRIAGRLAQQNPCWDDQTLFQAARSINIAQNFHIYYYELIPTIIGRESALKNGIIFETKGYVNDYDERLEPGSYVEFIQGTRWFHTFQDARTSTYTQKGKYTGFRATVDDILHTGVLEVNDTLEQLTQGSFRQESAKFDTIFDPDLAERLYGGLQDASDLISIDIMRSRDLGLRTYNDYRQLCGLPRARTFKDFADAIDVSKVEIISRLYEEPDDVDLTTGVYAESFIQGGWTGPTLFCIMARQWQLWRRSDRFFYEHGDQPTSFTLPQLNEIRKSSIARVLCDSGDGVRRIQPRGFYRPMLGNPIIPCDQIEGIDFRAWRDDKCYKVNEKISVGAYDKDVFGYRKYIHERHVVNPSEFVYSMGLYGVKYRNKEERNEEKKYVENNDNHVNEMNKKHNDTNEMNNKDNETNKINKKDNKTNEMNKKDNDTNEMNNKDNETNKINKKDNETNEMNKKDNDNNKLQDLINDKSMDKNEGNKNEKEDKGTGEKAEKEADVSDEDDENQRDEGFFDSAENEDEQMYGFDEFAGYGR